MSALMAGKPPCTLQLRMQLRDGANKIFLTRFFRSGLDMISVLCCHVTKCGYTLAGRKEGGRVPLCSCSSEAKLAVYTITQD